MGRITIDGDFDRERLADAVELLGLIGNSDILLKGLKIEHDRLNNEVYAINDEGKLYAVNCDGKLEQAYELSGTCVFGFYGNLTGQYRDGLITHAYDLADLLKIAQSVGDNETAALIAIDLNYDDMVNRLMNGKLSALETRSMRIIAAERDDNIVVDFIDKAAKSAEKTRKDKSYVRED